MRSAEDRRKQALWHIAEARRALTLGSIAEARKHAEFAVAALNDAEKAEEDVKLWDH